MEKGIHGLSSILFPAQITPIYFFTLLLAGQLTSHLLELAVAIFFSSIVQLVSLFVYVKSKNTDLFLSDRKERTTLFYIAIFSYALGFLILLLLHATFIVSALMLSYAINTLAAAIINKFEKVSLHTWGISGPAVALFYQYGYPVFFAAIVFSLVVGFSRVKTKAHTVPQVAIAILVSVPLTFLVVYYLAPII